MDDDLTESVGAFYPALEREGLRPLREHRAFIAVFVLAAILSALALTYIYSERYRAETTIFFKPSDVTELNTHSMQAFGSPFPYTEFKAVTQTVVGLVESDALLRRVVTDLHLEVKEPRDVSGAWYRHYYKEAKYALTDYGTDAWMVLKWGRIIEEDPVEKAIIKLRRQVKMRNNDSYLFTLQVSWDTPQRAIAIADDLATRLIDLQHREDLRSSSKHSEELAALRDGKAREIEAIDTKIRDLLVSNEIASVKDELEKVTERASKLQQERTDALADLRQSEAKIASLTEKLRVSSAPLAVRDDENAITRRPSRISADDYTKFTSKNLDTDVESKGLRARLASIEQSYGALRPRLQRLTEVQAQHDLMSAQLELAKRAYQTFSGAFDEAVIRATTGKGDLRLQAKAEAAPGPVSPIKIYHVGLAGLLAALIAVGLAYVLDFFGIGFFMTPTARQRRRWSEASVVRSHAAEDAPVRFSAD